MKLPFAKMHGLGNDFVLIDERAHAYGLDHEQMRLIADRRLGVGCDQLLFLDPPRRPGAAARYRIHNADGSAAEHCGNGIRCVAHYLARRREARDSVMIEVGEDVFEMTLLGEGRVRADMGTPAFEPAAIPLAAAVLAPSYELVADGTPLRFGAVSIGNPHAVIEVPAVAAAEVGRLGPAVQANAMFPAGVNVGFMQIVSPDEIGLRVYERGAGETRACGTGACAAVAIGRIWDRLGERVTVHLAGGDLEIAWPGGAAPLTMTGPATFVFEGQLEL
ncbi:MAG: diaminopimelate epimerase [Gammaproteobacteria bacterium]